MYCRPAPISLSSAYTWASSLMESFTRRMSCSWLPGWQCTSCRQSSMSSDFSVLNSSRISVMNRPNLDFSPAEALQRPEPSLNSLTRTPMRRPTRCARAWACGSSCSARARDAGAVVLEAVAHDEPLGRVLRHRHHGKQLRLGAHLEPEAELLPVAVDLLD